MINGIFCHYEPPDDHNQTKSILRRPKSRRAHRDASIKPTSSHRKIRWSDEPNATTDTQGGENPFELNCVTTHCVDAAVEVGVVPSSPNHLGQMDYELRETFSEDSGLRPRKSRAHHHVMFDDDGNPVPTKPGVRVQAPPPRPPPKRKEMFIPELCGVRIGDIDEDDAEYDEESDRSHDKKKKQKKKGYPSPEYERPDHSRYRPSYEYREEDDNSLITEEMAAEMRRQMRQEESEQRQERASQVDGRDDLPPPPPPPPPPRRTSSRQQVDQAEQAIQDSRMSVIDRNSRTNNGHTPSISSKTSVASSTHKPVSATSFKQEFQRDYLEECRGNLRTIDQDWGSQTSIDAADQLDCSNVTSNSVSTALVPVSKGMTSALEFCGSRDDWDESLPVLPCDIKKKKQTEEPPKLDAPDSRDSQEENKPLRYTPKEIEESEAGTELEWHSPVSKRLSFFKRGRNRDKRSSFPGRVQVVEDETGSQISKTPSQKSFLGFRSRSKSPGRKRIFGRSRSSEINSGTGDDGDTDRQSFIGAYRDSIDITEAPTSETTSNLHPAHPLNRKASSRMSRDDMMERQSFITAHRESMDSDGDSKVQTIAERLRRFRAQKAQQEGGGPVDLDDDIDDERFERQSMITAHRESFENPEKRKALVKVREIQRPTQSQGLSNDAVDVPEHLKTYVKPKIHPIEEVEEKQEEKEEIEPELTWEERTRQAWERLRSGLGLSTDEADEKIEEPTKTSDQVSHQSTSSTSDAKQVTDTKSFENSVNDDSAHKDTAESAEDEDSKETLVEEEPTTLTTLANLFASATMSSTDSKPSTPLKSILKSPSSEKRVTFGQDQERIFHDDQNENDSTTPLSEVPASTKRTSLLGRLVRKKGSPSPQKAVPVNSPPRRGRSPLQQTSNPQRQRSQSPEHLRSPSPMQPQFHYMYPPYPQPYPPMMPTTSPMNGQPTIPPSSSCDSSLQQIQQQCFPFMQQMSPTPVISTDSSQSQQQQQQQQQHPEQSSAPQQYPLQMYSQQHPHPPPYMPAPYFYGYPPNYGGYMYPPPMMMPVVPGLSEEPKKKKRIFRGRKLLSGVLSNKGGGGKEQQSLGLGGSTTMTMSSSQSMDGYGTNMEESVVYHDDNKKNDESAYFPTDAQAAT